MRRMTHKIASEMGKIGGKAGGYCKCRGGSKYYKELSKKAVEAKRSKIKENSPAPVQGVYLGGEPTEG